MLHPPLCKTIQMLRELSLTPIFLGRSVVTLAGDPCPRLKPLLATAGEGGALLMRGCSSWSSSRGRRQQVEADESGESLQRARTLFRRDGNHLERALQTCVLRKSEGLATLGGQARDPILDAHTRHLSGGVPTQRTRGTQGTREVSRARSTLGTARVFQSATRRQTHGAGCVQGSLRG